MTTLAERLKSPTLRREVKQRRLVLELTTAIEDELNRRDMSMTALAALLGRSKALISRIFRRQPNLTFFTAVELADALDMDIKLSVVPRREHSNVLYMRQTVHNGAPANVPAVPVSEGQFETGSMAV